MAVVAVAAGTTVITQIGTVPFRSKACVQQVLHVVSLFSDIVEDMQKAHSLKNLKAPVEILAASACQQVSKAFICAVQTLGIG